MPKKQQTKNKKEFEIKGDEIVEKTKKIVSESVKRYLVIKNKSNKVVIEIPLLIAIIFGVIFFWLSILVIIILLAMGYILSVVKK